MLTLFISYHPDDTAALSTLLEWLDPLRHKYFVHIWYYRYDPSDEVNVMERAMMRESANVYLFLISHKWVADRHIQTQEVEPIIERMHLLGKEWVYLFPVQVKPSQWKQFSKLVEVVKNTLPAENKEISKYDTKEEPYNLITQKVATTIQPLRERLIEEAKLKGLPTLGYFTIQQTPKEKAPRRGTIRFTLEDVKSWALVLLLLYAIGSVYYIGCNSEPFR